MKFKIFSRFKSIYIKLLLSFSIVTILLSAILSSVLYYSFEKSALGIVYQSNMKLLSQISYSANYMNDLARSFCKTVFFSDTVIPLMYSKTEDIWKMGNALRKLDISTVPATYIHSVYTYNRSLDLYLSTSTNSFYDSISFFDREIVDTIGLAEVTKLIPVPRRVLSSIVNNSTKEFTNVYTYYLYSNSQDPTAIDGAVIVNIKEDWLRNTISSIDSNTIDNVSSIFIIDDHGAVVSHTSPDMFLEDISSTDYIKKILSLNENSGFFIDTINKEKYVVTFVASGVLNWKFITLTPYQSVASTVQRVKMMTVIFCIIILLLALFFSTFLSKKLYTPIDALVESVKKKLPPSTGARKSMNEINFLSNAFTQVIAKTDVLENLKRNNMQSMKNEFLKNIVIGNSSTSSEDMDSKFTELSIQLSPEEKILLLILKIDHFKTFLENFSEKDRYIYKFAIANITNEVLGEYFKNEVVDMGSDHLCVLLNSADDSGHIKDDFSQSTKSCISEIQKHIRKYFHLSLSAAVGYITEDITKINAAYNEALNISLYRIKYGHSCIIYPENLNHINDDSFVFPSSKEKLLLDSIKLGNFEQAKNTYYAIISTLTACSYDHMISSISYLAFSIYNCINTIGKNNSCKFIVDFNTFIKHINNFETLDEINEMFVALFKETINYLQDGRTNKSDKIVNNVINIVKANYYDKNLCLNSIASSLKMSSIYLGRLFKDATSCSVADYITELRLEKVKHLMDTSTLSISEILDKTGFEKSNYFYTTFKKHFGISLSEYKMTHAEKLENL